MMVGKKQLIETVVEFLKCENVKNKSVLPSHLNSFFKIVEMQRLLDDKSCVTVKRCSKRKSILFHFIIEHIYKNINKARQFLIN